jgi:hypothetical protein
MKVILFFTNLQIDSKLIKQISKKRDFHNVLYTLFFCISKTVEKFGVKGKLQKKNRYTLTIISKEME